MPRVLLTAFEPYDEWKTNASWLALVELTKRALAAEPEKRLRNASVVAEGITSYLSSVQERLKSAELARVESRARAEEERRRRKLSLAIAQLVINLIFFTMAKKHYQCIIESLSMLDTK